MNHQIMDEQMNEDALLFDLVKPLSAVEAQDAKWAIENWIPEGHITLLVADGGVGKTTLWCNLLAALSAGRRCILDPEGVEREPMRVMYFSAEDSTAKKLKGKIALLEPNQDNILSLAETKAGLKLLHSIHFHSEELHQLIRRFRPAICVFDPIQGFIAPSVNMASRNAMRDCLEPLIALGHETGTAFLLVCHTNKRKGASGRDRVSDSADLWDGARSVLMMGRTADEGVLYLSQEKTNYGEQQDTLLLSIVENGVLVREGTTKKRDRDFIMDAGSDQRGPSKHELCERYIMELLEAQPEKRIRGDQLIEGLMRRGVTYGTIRRVRGEMVRVNKIHKEEIYESGKPTWYFRLYAPGEKPWESELPFGQENPFIAGA